MEDDVFPQLLPLPLLQQLLDATASLFDKIALLFCCNIDRRLFRSNCGESCTRDLCLVCKETDQEACLAVLIGCNDHLMSTHVALEVKCRKNTKIFPCQKSDNDWYISGMLPKDSV